MKKISAEQFKAQYGDAAVSRFSAINNSRVGSTPQSQSLIGSQLNPFGQANKERLADIPSDIRETFTSAVDSVSGGIQTAQDVRSRVATGETTPLAGTGQIIGAGLSAGAGVVGSALTGFGKLFTRQQTENKIREKVTSATEKVAEQPAVQKLREQYNALPPEQQRNLDAFFGAAEGFGTMFGAGPVFKTLRNSLKTTGSLAEQGTSATAGAVTRTAQDAANQVLEQATNVTNTVGGVVQPATDIARGIGQQVGDFARRTAEGAKDTATRNRALSQLPPQEAAIRRVAADERVIDVIQRAPETETTLYKELVEQAKKKEQFPEDPNVSQPKQIAGREFLHPVEYIIKKREDVGAKLGDSRKNLSTEKNINTNNAFRNFRSYLKDDLGVQFNAKDEIIPGTGSIAQSDIAEVQKLYNELRPKVFMSQREVDEFLRRTLDEYDLRQAREKTFSDKVSRIAERARSEMGQLMPEEYNSLRTQYAELSKPLGDMVKLLNYKGSLDELSTKDLKAGEVALRVLGNAADRPQSVIDSVLDTAQKQGYSSEVDLNRLIYITDQLEDLYDITPSRSFSGSTARGVEQGGLGVVSDAATMNVGGLFNQAMSSRASREEVRKAFEAYINGL